MDAGKPQKQSLAIAYAMKKKAKKMAMGGYAEGGACMAHGKSGCEMCMAEGGMVDEEAEYDPVETPHSVDNESAETEDDDMVSRIMRQKYSKGGMVANEDKITAGFEPNEFDDLALRDDLESSYTGANSGDELGNDQEDEDRRDIVSRIMRSRAKRDRLPRPA